MVKKKVVEIFTLEMRDIGILHVHAGGENPVDLRRYKLMVNAIGEMTGGKKVPILSTADELTIPDEEVRQYMIRKDANPYCSALALMTSSISQKLISGFVLRILKPSRPIKRFTKEAEAIAWLKTFL